MKTKKEKLDPKVFGDIFDGIMQGALQEAMTKYPDLVAGFEKVDAPEDFWYSFIYPLQQSFHGAMAKKYSVGAGVDNPFFNLKFLFWYNDFVDGHLTKLIIRQEGSPCSADKARWLCKALVNYYRTGKKPDMEIPEKCYWKPHFWTGEEWIKFYEALVDLYHGDPTKYLVAMKKLIEEDIPKNETS